MTTLRFLDLSTNKLSGSFSTSFGARSQLIFLAISGNVGLVRHLHNDFFLELAAPQDWDLSVFDLCSSITYLLMQVILMPQTGLVKPCCCAQDCSIGGTLPSLLSRATQLNKLLLVVATV